MSLRCTNCGAPLVLPVPAPPLVSCSYCAATIAVAPQFQAQSVAPPAPPRERALNKLWYAVGGAVLVAGGALLGPLAQGLTSSPSALTTTGDSAVPDRDAVPATPSAPAAAAPVATIATATPDVAARPAAVDPAHVASPIARGVNTPTIAAPPALPAPVAAAPTPAPTATPTATTPSAPRSVRVSMGSPSIVGTNSSNYDIAAVRRVLPQASSAVRACYQAALVETPDAAGGINMSFQIELDGSVAGAGVTGSFLPSNLISCINRSMYTLHFPPPQPHVVDIRTVITLSAN